MFSIEEYVTASRTGVSGRLKLVSAIDMMQDCSQLWMKSEPVVENYFRENNLSQLLASRQLDIIRIPVYGERLTITTTVFECQGVQGFRNTVIYDEAAIPCMVSWSTGAFVSLETNRLTRLPEEITATLTLDKKVEMEYLERKIIIPAGETKEMSPVAVGRNEIDMNRHMNNVHYIRIAVESLPEDFCVKRLRVEYKVPARRGDLLTPRVTQAAHDAIYVKLLNSNGKTCALVEFTGTGFAPEKE